MSLTLTALKEIGRDAGDLFRTIKELREADQDDKTDAIEARALALVAKAEAALAATQEQGTANRAELKATFEAQKATLEARLDSDLTLNEQMLVLTQMADLDFKIAAIQIEGTLTWDRLLSETELQAFRESLKQAAVQVRRRIKLQRIARSVFSIFTVALRLASKVAML